MNKLFRKLDNMFNRLIGSIVFHSLLFAKTYIYIYIFGIKASYFTLILLVFDFPVSHRFETSQSKRNLYANIYANIRFSDRRYPIKIFDGSDFGSLDSLDQDLEIIKGT